MGFGAMQFTVILLSSWLAWRFKIKSIILAAFMVPGALRLLSSFSSDDR